MSSAIFQHKHGKFIGNKLWPRSDTTSPGNQCWANIRCNLFMVFSVVMEGMCCTFRMIINHNQRIVASLVAEIYVDTVKRSCGLFP